METEINQYLAEQRGLAEEQRQERRDRNTRDRDRKNRDRGRRNRFSERDDREERDRDRDYNNRARSDRDSWDSPRDRSERDGYVRNERQGDRGRRAGGGGGGRTTSERPSRTIMLKNCHNSVDDSDIRTVLQLFGAPIKDVRLVKHRDTGVSRGFAFVEFQFLPDAQRWMEENQGRVQIAGHWAQMVYSANREREEDWFCSQCGTHNFKRREYCFKCSIPKDESEKYSEISSIPTTTLLLMGLDALTTEETVSRTLNDISAVDMNIRIARDPLTNTSRGLCYVDFATLELSSHVLDILCTKMSPAFSIDAKQVSTHYCKAPQVQTLNGIATGANALPLVPTSTNVASTAIAAAQWSTTADKQANLAAAQEALQQHTQQSGFDNSYYTQQYGVAQQQAIAQQQLSLQQYAAVYQQSTATSETSSAKTKSSKNNSGKKSSAIDVAGTPIIKQAVDEREENYSNQSDDDVEAAAQEYSTVTVDGVEYPVYPPPDVSQYQYDDASGYYYDPTTSLYYDATSQYYYNSVTQLHMFWDSSKSTYLPAPSGVEHNMQPPPASIDSNQDSNNQDSNDQLDPGRKDSKKNKMAQKVAKDMARWAKSQNTARMSASKKAMAAAAALAFRNANAGAADAGFSMLMKKADPKETKATVISALKRKVDVDPNPIVASYGGGSDSDEELEQNGSSLSGSSGNQSADQPMTDWSKLICLLCKRQFPSQEVLVKHQQFSELHKQNMEAMKARTAQEAEITYRDRAKERRDKYGPADPPQPKKNKYKSNAPVPYEEPTKAGIGEDNIGNKMLKAMGWNANSGLGKKHQGRRDPIEVSRRRAGSGLGLKGSGYVADGDTYKDNVKKMTQYRYQELV